MSSSASGSSFKMPVTTEEKVARGKELKAEGDALYKEKKFSGAGSALQKYNEALAYLKGLDKNALQSIGMASNKPATGDPSKDAKERTEVDEIVETIYGNMTACHIQNDKWDRVLTTCNTILAKNEANYKALFRKGRALAKLSEPEKALKILEDVKAKCTDEKLLNEVTSEIAKLRADDKAREKVYRQGLKGFLNKEKKPAVDAPEKA
ncbi:hypothetical protein BDQ12DRAFT_680447 [Crucibulum laeve]|uniref:TPR-like protein n=1 Tax=Crucibulum laeve TaxID=68775 RepID=A0A5C3M8I1_9AGAR|nr:hypothetical protein BDQ12DRAFT_680447 [Crucibulum laeve]